MKKITFGKNTSLNTLGQGTWHMGQDSALRKTEADALRYGMDLGMTLIDTAEMYHDAELVVAKALQGRREEAYVVSKVLPSNASRRGTISACENSLRRLQIETIDLYLLHWMGSHPLEETIDGFVRLIEQGKIQSFGVSNLDLHEMQEIQNFPEGGAIATNQVLYNLQHRGIEWDLLPWCREYNIPIMAYSPLNQGRLESPVLQQLAAKYQVNKFQIALAWVLHQDGVMAIPKSANKHHLDENLQASKIELSAEDLQKLDQGFPPPKSATPLDMI